MSNSANVIAMQFEKINPLSNAVASVSEAMQASDVAGIVAQAQEALDAWSATLPNERRRVLMQAAASLQDKQEQIVDVMLAETGCTKSWAVFNVMRAVTIIQEAAAMTTQISGELIPSDVPGCLAMAMRVPHRCHFGYCTLERTPDLGSPRHCCTTCLCQ